MTPRTLRPPKPSSLPVTGSLGRPHRARRQIVGALAVGVLLVGCDTGDGKTLREPTGTMAPVTLPATTTTFSFDNDATLPSVALDPSGDQSGDVQESDLPVELPGGPFALVAPWLDGGVIDPINTCSGADLSPALSWTGVPEGTVELAIAMVDDSVEPQFIHWVIAGIDPSEMSMIEGAPSAGAIEAINSFGDIGYGGPCPPQETDAHDYRTTIYALGQQVELFDGDAAADLLGFVQDASFASTEVTGTFGR